MHANDVLFGRPVGGDGFLVDSAKFDADAAIGNGSTLTFARLPSPSLLIELSDPLPLIALSSD